MAKHSFGGGWTSEKLESLDKYLRAYMQIMKKKDFFRVSYIDAFAGTGYIHQSKSKSDDHPSLIDFQDESAERFIDGSARVALNINPPFHKYVFIEQKRSFCRDLEKLKTDFPDRTIEVVNGTAATEINRICKQNWKTNRAVLFLDPYGMQVEWETIQAIAETKAIDMWYLFPLGVGVNRLLKKDGVIEKKWEKKLDSIFGTQAWREEFYRINPQTSLFNTDPSIEKAANFKTIKKFLIERLKTIFPCVAENARELYNSKGNPLYLLCFAAGNEKGGKIAMKIANHILKN